MHFGRTESDAGHSSIGRHGVEVAAIAIDRLMQSVVFVEPAIDEVTPPGVGGYRAPSPFSGELAHVTFILADGWTAGVDRG